MSESFQDALAGLAAIVGDRHVIASGPDQEPYVTDWRGRYHGRAVAVVKPGRILYEMEGMTREVATGALKLAQAKLPVLTKIVTRADLSL